MSDGYSEQYEKISYKLKPVHIHIRPDKLVDISVGHPFGYHREAVNVHHHAHQREHVRMTEGIPRDNFSAETLHDSGQFLTTHFWVGTHVDNLIEVAPGVYSQDLDCNLSALMFTHPHVGVSALVQRILRSVITKRDTQ